MKNFLFILIAVVLLAGCEDQFTGPPTLVPEELGNRVVYTRWEGGLLVNGVPTGSIVQRELGSSVESVIIPEPAYLLCAPQNGKMLYAQYTAEPDSDQVMEWEWHLKISDVDGENSATILKFGGIFSVLLQDVVLSHDGTMVAYAVTEAQLDQYNRLVERVYLYRRGTGIAEPIDSMRHTTLYGSGTIEVKSLLSQLAFSPDDSQLAAAFWGQDRSIRVYNTTTGERRLLGTRTGPFVAWSPDGQKLLYSKNVGIYSVEPIFSVSPTSIPIQYMIGFPSSSTLAIVDLSNASTELIKGLPPVFDVAWSPDGSRIAFSQLRMPGTLFGGTDIVSFDYNDHMNRDTLTLGMSEFMTRTRLQWAGDNTRLLFSQGYYPPVYPDYSALGSEIGSINATHRGCTVLDRGAFGVYWLDPSATSLPTPGKPQPADSLYVAEARD